MEEKRTLTPSEAAEAKKEPKGKQQPASKKGHINAIILTLSILLVYT